MEDFRATLARSLELVLLLTIPASVGLAVVGRSMIGAVYQWGRFQPSDTEQTARAVVFYSIGLAGYAAIKVLAPAFYALGDARTPMAVSLSSIVVNLAAAKALLAWTDLGHAGLALSTSLVALFSATVLTSLLGRRVHGFGGAAVIAATGKIIVAAAVMGAVCLLASRSVHVFAGAGKSAQFTDVALTVPLGAAVFYTIARALRIPGLESLRSAWYFESNASGPKSGNSTPGN
jgi:putative peptidoglycan lipid II flippase